MPAKYINKSKTQTNTSSNKNLTMDLLITVEGLLAGVTEWVAVALWTMPAAVTHITHMQTWLFSSSFPTDVAQSAQGQMGPDMEDIKTS